MSQRRYVNFGTDADAAKVKAVNAVLASPQLMSASEPFMQASPPDTLVVAPHSLIFDGGIVLVEDEQLTFTVPTSFGATDFTLAYTHVDEDIIGGTAATIELTSGLQQTVPNGVPIGWVRYPGGSVPLDSTMLFPARQGQARPDRLTREVLGTGTVTARSPTVTLTTDPQVLLTAVPTSPYQVTLGQAFVSRLLAVDAQRLVVYDHTAGVEMTRITSGTPATTQYLVDTGTGVVTFAAVDTGHTVDISDMTYGAGLRHALNGSASTAAVVDTVYSFPVTEAPLMAFTAEFIPLATGYTVSVRAAYDVLNAPITTASSLTAPTVANGTAGRLVVRFLDGTRNGTAGRFVTVRMRETLPALASGLLLRARATTYDLPF